MTFLQSRGHTCGPCCSVQQWRTSHAPGQTAWQRSRRSLLRQGALHRTLPSYKRYALLQQVPQQRDGRRQTSPQNSQETARGMSSTFWRTFRKSHIFLLFGTLLASFLHHRLPLLAACESLPVDPLKHEVEAQEAHSQQPSPPEGGTPAINDASTERIRPALHMSLERDRLRKDNRIQKQSAHKEPHHVVDKTDEMWGTPDSVLPVATAILKAAEVAAPDLLERSRTATENTPSGTSPEDESGHVNDITGERGRDAATQLKAAVATALQAILPDAADGVQSVLLSIMNPSFDTQVLETLEADKLLPTAPMVGRECRAPEKTVFRTLKRSPSSYYRGLYPNEAKLEEHVKWEIQPLQTGGDVVKLRSSYAKAPSATKRTCNRSPRGGPKVCALLREAQAAMEVASYDSEMQAHKLDEVMENMIGNLTLKDGRMDSVKPPPSTNTASKEEDAADNRLHSLRPNELAEFKEFLSSLDIDTGKDGQEPDTELAEKQSVTTSSFGHPVIVEKDTRIVFRDTAQAEKPTDQGLDPRLSTQRSTDTMDSVTEVIDMTDLGEAASFNLEAFFRQRTCGNLYSTLLLDSVHRGPNVECVLVSLSSHARNVAKRAAKAAFSSLVRAFTRVFSCLRNDEIALDMLRSAQLTIAKAVRRATSTNNRPAANTGNLLNAALKARPESIPFFITLVTSLVVCQASLPYNMRPLMGYPVIPLKSRVPLPAMQYLHRVGAYIEMLPHAPSKFPLDLHNIKDQQSLLIQPQPWKQRLFRSLFIVWNLVYHMYHLGERPADFAHQNVDSVFPWPWRLTYVGSCLWSERIPVRNCDGSVSSQLQNDADIAALIGHEGATGSSEQKLLAQKVGKFSRTVNPRGTLPYASPDTCGPDATHRVTVESPLFARVDLHPDADARGFAYQHIDFIQASRRVFKWKKRRPRITDAPELLLDISAHVETCWLFKGTDSPKQWNLDSQLLARHDKAFSPKARLHAGFSAHFHNSVRGAMEAFIKEAREKGQQRTSRSPYVILFAGHSLGGALAQLAAWYAAIHLQQVIQGGKILLFCITFGSPSVGDKQAYSEMSKIGIKFFRLKSDTDPVPVIVQDANLSSLHSPDEATLEIQSSDFTRIALRDSHGHLYFHGLLWSEDNLQPLRLQKWLLRLATSPMNWNALVDVRLHPMNSHMFIYACTLTLLAGAFRAADWSSMCAAPLVNKWPLMPMPASPDMELEMQKAHRELPGKLAMLEEKIMGSTHKNVDAINFTPLMHP